MLGLGGIDDLESIAHLLPLQLALVAKQADALDGLEVAGILTHSVDADGLSGLGLVHGEGIELAVLAHGEADVLHVELEVSVPPVQASARELLQVSVAHLALAHGDPCLAAIDGLGIDVHPVAHLFEHGDAIFLDAAVGAHGDVERCVAVAADGLDDEAYHAARVIGEAGGIEPVAHGCLTDPGLRGLDLVGEVELFGGYRAIGGAAELDDGEGIHLAALLELAVVVVGHHGLHGVALVSGAGAIACEGALHGAVGVDEVGVVVGHHVHHAQCPLGGIPLAVVEVVAEDTGVGGRPWRVCTLFDGLILA